MASSNVEVLRSWGAIVATVRTRHFTATEAVYGKGTVIATHVHDAPSITLCVSGAYVEQIGTDAVSCDDRSMAVKPAYVLHENSYSAESRLIVVNPAPQNPDPDIAEAFRRTQYVRSPLVRRITLAVWSELHRRDRLAGLAIDAKLFELAADLVRSRGLSAPPSRLRKAFDIIGDSPQTTIDVKVLAAMTGLPVRSFLKQFQAETGCTVTEYVRRNRIERAKQSLLRSDTDLRTLALELGYCDQSHFTNTFRRHVGMTPNEFRRSAS